MITALRQALAARKKVTLAPNGRTPAAVLVPIYAERGDYFVILTQRTHRVRTHKGQISFPGGSRDARDRSFLETALRESYEEVGIEPSLVDILGELDDHPTHTSYYMITPFVGLIPWPIPLSMNENEASEILRIPISALLDPRCMSEGSEIEGHTLIPACFYTWNGRVIWGATARILHQFLEIWQAASLLKNG